MSKKRPLFDFPSEVHAAGENVEVDGPDDSAYAFTADAAEETSDRLLGAALKARGHQRLERMPHRPKGKDTPA